MKSKKVWNGEYRSIPFEINKFKIGGKDCWTFYLFFREKQFNEDFFESIWIDGKPLKISPRHIVYRYEETAIGNLNWHCGCTFYSKSGGHDGNQRVVQAGCDYQHLWDEGNHYNEHVIEKDACECIDSLYKYVTPKRWCTWCGEYFTGSETAKRCDKCVDK